MTLKPPVAEKHPVEIIQHENTRVDNYAWLRDENWQKIIAGELNFENPKIKDYIDSENAYTEQELADTKDLQKKLYDEMVGHLNEDDETYPLKRGDYFYSSRTEKGKNYPYLCRRKGAVDAPEEVYFDVNKEADGHELYMMKSSRVSENQRYLAYGFNLTGSLAYTVKVRDLETGKDFNWEAPDTEGNFEWCNDNTHLYYTVRHPELGRAYRVYRINIFEGDSSKQMIFERPEEHADKFLMLEKTTSKQYLRISLNDSESDAIYFWDAKDPDGEPKLFTPYQKGLRYTFEHIGDQFFVLTNADGAINFKVDSASVGQQEKPYWTSVIPVQDDVYLENLEIFGGHLILGIQENSQARPGLLVSSLDFKKSYNVQMKEDSCMLHFIGAGDFDSEVVRFLYESPIQPEQTIDLNLITKEQTVQKTVYIPNYDRNLYELKKEFVEASDGALVPLTIVHKKGLKLDGSNPSYLYAYGSYGMTFPNFFSGTLISLYDRGYVCAVAHVRGGSDKGYSWYLDGKLHKKKNTFTDFNSCAEHLISKGYTAKGRIAAHGGSAGGLLMGAISNMRPDLYGAVVAEVAFVDMINTISDRNLPLTPPEWEEWGNPITSFEDFQYMMSYSPYDNVKAQDYPHTLYLSGISDEQVTYWEPAKMVAKLRDLKTDNNTLLLEIKMASGHAGASKRYQALEEKAFYFAFVLKYCS